MRSVAWFGIFFLFWITASPFVDLRDPAVLLAQEDGSLVDQLCALTAFAVALMFLNRRRAAVRAACSPALFATVAWGFVSVATSSHPDLSARRFVLTCLVLVLSLATVLIPRDEAQFSRYLAIGSAAVLALAYFGVLFLPAVSIHSLAEVLEPDNAGSWRGHFSHKNIAGAAMVYLVIFGCYIAHRQGRLLGCALVALAVLFLVQSHSKTALGLIVGVFALVALVERARPFWLKLCLTLVPVGAMLLFTVGSVLFAPVGALVAAVASDPTFTNRTMIWSFTLDNIATHPLLGYGFEAFWKTSALVNGDMTETAAADAAHAHDAYLNVAVTMGIPGLLLTMYWVVWQPLRDFHTCQGSVGSREYTRMNLRIWLFTLLSACLENVFFVNHWPVWFTFLLAIFGLRLSARAKQVRNAAPASVAPKAIGVPA